MKPTQLSLQIPAVNSCLDCGSTKVLRKPSGPHLGVYCAKCGRWLKWEAHEVNHNPNFVITFGKYAGTKISLLPTDYLLYAVKEWTGAMRERAKLALQKRTRQFVQAAKEILETNPRFMAGQPIPLDWFVAVFVANYPAANKNNIVYWLDQTKDELGLKPQENKDDGLPVVSLQRR